MMYACCDVLMFFFFFKGKLRIQSKKDVVDLPPRKKLKKDSTTAIIGNELSQLTAMRTQMLAFVREATHTFAPQKVPRTRFMLWDPHNKKSCVIMLYERLARRVVT